jgi:hypothetical protein
LVLDVDNRQHLHSTSNQTCQSFEIDQLVCCCRLWQNGLLPVWRHLRLRLASAPTTAAAERQVLRQQAALGRTLRMSCSGCTPSRRRCWALPWILNSR